MLKKISSASQRLNSFVEQIPFAIAILDREMNYLSVSQKWLSDYRLSDSDLYGKNHYVLFPEISEEWKKVHARCLAGATEGSASESFVRSDGRTDWIRWEVQPWYDENSNIGGILIFSEDITARIQSEQELKQSEARRKLAMDASQMGAWEWDLANQKVFWDETTQKLFGYHGDFPGTVDGFLSRLHPDDRKSAWEEAEKVIFQRGSKEYLVAYRALWQDGSLHWISAHGRLQVDPKSGEPLRIVGTVSDITRQKIVEEALSSERERFRRAANASGLGVWYCDLPFGDLIWDHTVKEHFWLSHQAHVTIDVFYERIHPDDRVRTRQAIDYSIQNHAPYDIEYRTTHPSNVSQFKWIRALGWTDYDAHEVPIRFDGITLDVTQKKKTELALKDAVVARDDFLSVASHEFKTPITALKMQLQMLRRAIKPEENVVPSPKKLAQTLDLSIRQVERLTGLVENLLDVSRIESGKMLYSFELVDLSALLTEVVEGFSEQFKIMHCPLEISVPDSCNIICDRFRVEQVVTNLITNAIKYGEGSKIQIRLVTFENAVFLSVSDQGMGIAKDKQSKIFDRFERAISHNNISGLGLGLYISKQIVEAHGGKIELESELSKGSTFTVKLFRN